MSKRLSIRIPVSYFYFLLIELIYCVSLGIWASARWDTVNTNYESLVFPWVVISLILHLIAYFIIKHFSYVDVAMWFSLLSYIFLFGHVFISELKLETNLNWNPAGYFHNSDKFQASVYLLFCLSALTCGYLLNSKRINNKVRYNDLDVNTNVTRSLGWVLFVVGFVCNFINIAIIVRAVALSNSYTAYMEAAQSLSLLSAISYLLVPGYAFIISSGTISGKRGRFFTILIILYLSATMILSGSRKTQLFEIIAIVLCYLWMNARNQEKLRIRQILLLIVFAVLFLNLIYSIRENRTDLKSIMPSFLSSLTTFDFIRDIGSETLAESGLTFYSVAAIIMCVPSVFPFQYGMSFIRTLPSCLPLGWLIGDFIKKGASQNVINAYTRIPVGGSLFGDFYWNFGFVGGVICSFVLGILFARLMRWLDEANPYRSALYFCVLSIVLIGVRAGFFELFRPIFMVTVIPLIVRAFFTHNSRKGKI